MKGPFAIICRGHSGSRLLCEVYRQNRIWMGICDGHRDTERFGQRSPVVQELVRAGFVYDGLSSTEKARLQRLVIDLVEASRADCPASQPAVAHGWKRPIMTFACEIFMDAYPEAKTVHLIRDGRDAMLSRLRYRMRHLHEPLNRLVVFGTADVSEYRGLPLDRETVDRYRNEIEMHHWITAVRFGMRARRYGERYLEVRYEDLCERPEDTLHTVFEFLDVPFLEEARDWIRANARVTRVSKWKGREDELSQAMTIGEPLLRELGYA